MVDIDVGRQCTKLCFWCGVKKKVVMCFTVGSAALSHHLLEHCILNMKVVGLNKLIRNVPKIYTIQYSITKMSVKCKLHICFTKIKIKCIS